MSTLIENVSFDSRQFSFEQTVPRSLVHKRSLENVLLTEIKSCGDDRFTCAGYIPTAHRFFNESSRDPRKDILFYTELGRQASLAISHAYLGVSQEQVFIFEQSEAALKAAAWQPTSQGTSDSVVTEITILETEKRRNTVSRVVAKQTMSVGRDTVFHGVGAWTIQPPALFQRLRRMSAIHAGSLSGVAPYGAGGVVQRKAARNAGDNVVITDPTFDEDRGEFSSFLLVNDSHPYFFDHSCDHVPGMLLLEGCAQLAVAAVSKATGLSAPEWTVSDYDVNFQQFVEFGVPTVLTARLNPSESNQQEDVPTTVEISIAQQNSTSGTATMSVVFPIYRS